MEIVSQIQDASAAGSGCRQSCGPQTVVVSVGCIDGTPIRVGRQFPWRRVGRIRHEINTAASVDDGALTVSACRGVGHDTTDTGIAYGRNGAVEIVRVPGGFGPGACTHDCATL